MIWIVVILLFYLSAIFQLLNLAKYVFFCLVFSVSIITDTTLQAKDATESFEGRNCLQVLVQNMIRIVLLSLKSKKRKYPRHQSSGKK